MSNICVYASAEAKQPLAIIVPHGHNLRHALSSMKSAPSPSTSLPELCEDKTVKNMILDECNAKGRHCGLRQVEALCDVILTPEEWTPENGLLTAAQKLQRSKISKAFQGEIDVSDFFSYCCYCIEGRLDGLQGPELDGFLLCTCILPFASL